MAGDNFGRTISTKTTEVMLQVAPGKPPYVELNITIKKQRLKAVERFIYLGSTLSKSIFMDDSQKGGLNKNV